MLRCNGVSLYTCAALRGEGQLMAGPPLPLCLPLPAWRCAPLVCTRAMTKTRQVSEQMSRRDAGKLQLGTCSCAHKECRLNSANVPTLFCMFCSWFTALYALAWIHWMALQKRPTFSGLISVRL